MVLILFLVALTLAPAQPSFALPDSGRSQSPGHTVELSKEKVVRGLDKAIAKVQPLLERYGYPAVFLAIMVEGIGFIAPGQTLLIAAALAAARGNLNIFWVVIWALTAAVLGNTLGYVLGLWGGRPLLRKIKVNEQHLQRLEGYFARHGKGVVLIARFFDGLRQLNGIVAGMLEMPWKVFTLFNVLGAMLWTGFWALGAYFLEKKIAATHLTFAKIEPWIAALSILVFLALLVYLLTQRRANKD
jgi:membrane protein DedA with SNARE-associated domain